MSYPGKKWTVQRALSPSSQGEPGTNQRFIESREGGVVPVSERAPAWNDVTIQRVTDSLELPYAVNQLQVAHMLPLVDKDAVNAVI